MDDNRIESVERRAFMNLDKLRHLSLRGNKLTSISDEAFQVRSRSCQPPCWPHLVPIAFLKID